MSCFVHDLHIFTLLSQRETGRNITRNVTESDNLTVFFFFFNVIKLLWVGATLFGYCSRIMRHTNDEEEAKLTADKCRQGAECNIPAHLVLIFPGNMRTPGALVSIKGALWHSVSNLWGLLCISFPHDMD